MEWQIIVALVVAIPIILLPIVFVWFITIGGMLTAAKEARARRAAREKGIKETAPVKLEAK
ncbi:MAG: hypothetical protein JSV54_05840 [Chloroflexota bacterium]|nr:MAG: hypothetical protein JSV54_05840 [Chloroflexota bacterium]